VLGKEWLVSRDRDRKEKRPMVLQVTGRGNWRREADRRCSIDEAHRDERAWIIF